MNKRLRTVSKQEVTYNVLRIEQTKKIALVAHDHRKAELIDWCRCHREVLARHRLYATGATGALLSRALSLDVHCFQSGPLGGDLQIGASIVNCEIDFLVFFWDPLAAQPHDPDVKALLRIAALWDILVACNRASADFIVLSPLMALSYERLIPASHEDYIRHLHLSHGEGEVVGGVN